MNKKTKHIFIAGGGSAEDSKLIDQQFVSVLDLTKPLVYVPNAMKSRPYQLCFKWFRSVMNPLGVKNIEMWDDLQSRHSIDNIAGIYLGGGDTSKLIKELRASGFSSYLLEAVNAGVPVYGGSAGAIVFGEDIRTAPEAKNLNNSEAVGLQIVSGHLIVCHYDATKESSTRQLFQKFKYGILAIPEKAGGYISRGVLTNYGTESITIFQNSKIVHLNPNHSISLLIKRDGEQRLPSNKKIHKR